MLMANSILVCLIISVFNTYILYRYFCIFFNRNGTNKNIEILSYFAYFIILFIIYYFFKGEFIVSAIIELLLMFIISLNYESNIRQRLIALFSIAFILFSIKIIVPRIIGTIYLNILWDKDLKLTEFMDKYYLNYGDLMVPLFSYFILKLLESFENIKKGMIIPVSYWIGILITPILSIAIIYSLINTKIPKSKQVFNIVVATIFINIMLIYLYDNLIRSMEEKSENQLLKQQNVFYEKQFNTMKSHFDETREIRHDLNNHLIVIESMVKENNIDLLNNYIEEIRENFAIDKTFISSGNIIVDSILNFKLMEADKYGIEYSVEIVIPHTLPIEPFHMTIILGNLMDNAINALKDLEPFNRKMSIIIKLDRGVFLINIKNKFNGELYYKDGLLLTSQKDKDRHGFGLKNVKNTVDKYSGILDIEHTDNEFMTTIMIFI